MMATWVVMILRGMAFSLRCGPLLGGRFGAPATSVRCDG
jgi:hypothetical protein